MKINRAAGRVRMLFVSDVIPTELRRIIEFLNEQMDPAEILGVEIRQFVGDIVTALVPRLVGQTETARECKGVQSAARESISKKQYLEALADYMSSVECEVAAKLVKWAREKGLVLNFRKGVRGPAFSNFVTSLTSGCSPSLTGR